MKLMILVIACLGLFISACATEKDKLKDRLACRLLEETQQGHLQWSQRDETAGYNFRIEEEMRIISYRTQITIADGDLRVYIRTSCAERLYKVLEASSDNTVETMKRIIKDLETNAFIIGAQGK